MVRGRLTRHLGNFTSKSGVLTHNVEKPMTRRASLSSFKNTSSESTNAHEEKAGSIQSNFPPAVKRQPGVRREDS